MPFLSFELSYPFRVIVACSRSAWVIFLFFLPYSFTLRDDEIKAAPCGEKKKHRDDQEESLTSVTSASLLSRRTFFFLRTALWHELQTTRASTPRNSKWTKKKHAQSDTLLEANGNYKLTRNWIINEAFPGSIFSGFFILILTRTTLNKKHPIVSDWMACPRGCHASESFGKTIGKRHHVHQIT